MKNVKDFTYYFLILFTLIISVVYFSGFKGIWDKSYPVVLASVITMFIVQLLTHFKLFFDDKDGVIVSYAGTVATILAVIITLI